MPVLIVDDDAQVRRLVHRLVDDPTGRPRVRTAATLSGARVLLDREDFDVVLTSASLPDGDGPAIVQSLLARRPALPVVVYTEEDATSLLDHGAQEVFAPTRTSRDDLHRLLTHAIRRSAAGARRQSPTPGPARHLLEGYTRAVAHDIQRPLATIQMLAQAILSGRDHGLDTGELAHRIAVQAEQLQDFADVLLDDAIGDDEATVRDVALAPLVTRALDLYRGRLDAELISVDLPPELTVVGREGALLHALLNLLGNVAQHAGPHPTVSITAHTQGDRVVLTVDDDGPGVPPEDRERILAPGARLNGATGGHGLGLAAVDLVASTHAGRVRVEESPLGGLRVALVLPSAEAAPTTPRPHRTRQRH